MGVTWSFFVTEITFLIQLQDLEGKEPYSIQSLNHTSEFHQSKMWSGDEIEALFLNVYVLFMPYPLPFFCLFSSLITQFVFDFGFSYKNSCGIRSKSEHLQHYFSCQLSVASISHILFHWDIFVCVGFEG